MNGWSFIALAIAALIAPLIARFLTAPIRRWIRHGMNDGPLRRLFLTPIGYTKKARQEAAQNATLDDYHLLAPGSHKLRERNRPNSPALPAKRL